MDTTSTQRDLPEDAAAAPKPRRGAIQVYETLRDDILWLRIAPGSAIDEVALATRFEISRTPIREALMLLAGDGLVVFLPNRTSIVPPLSLHNMGEYMDMYLLLSRAVIRGVIQNLQAVDRDPLQSRLTDLLELLERAPGEPALRADLALRHWLGDLASNTFLNRYYRQILDAGIRSKILHFFPNSTPSDLAAMRLNWQALVDAIQHHDAGAADRIVSQMILSENEIILRSLHPRFGHELPLTSPPSTQEPSHA
jgi:DNA-binding GntR family transcriptional regulator